ncbi:PREDICTED: kinesin-like protein KIF19 [Wasmannia auropunctata]|uniref:kinesin-like protein KIF19 n=1 Tax=Wasmannia auropunctata TaxID=64793 RepID=UPI0005EF2655|nr:PREDICTED: kinesin-like protein KIF19 [Wasmannia auropunctata]
MKMTQYNSGVSSSSSSSSSSSIGHNNFKEHRNEGALEEKLMVAIRIRPLAPNESGTRCLHAINNKMVMLEDQDNDKQKRAMPRQYLYDMVFGESSTQEEVYEGTTKNLVQDVLNGYNATVFAYGATGSGKTHTMVGTSSNPGIMVRALNDIFLAAKKLSDNTEFTVTMSYMEIYNENIRDLLNPNSRYLDLRDDTRSGNVQVSGLTEVSTNSTEEVMQLLHRGNKARTMEPTAANKTSSRSHALLSVMIKQVSHRVQDDGQRVRNKMKQGRLFMIDLAGSERAKQTKNEGKRLQEGAHINRSLLALGNCINALSGGARYVNYRDSKLTRLLKEALSGNCRTVKIAHVSPASTHRDESKNTLIYADRANKISNKIERNVLDVSYLHVAQYRDIISDLKSEISRLRNKMKDERPKRVEVEKKNSDDMHGNDFKSLREKIVSAFKEQMRLRRKLMELDSHLLGLNIAAEQQHSIISHWESRNNRVYGKSRDSSTHRPGTDYQVDEIDDVDGRLALPPDLQNLYAMYQQEIQAATYVSNSLGNLAMSPTVSFSHGKLPPISSRFSIYDNLSSDLRIASSSTDSDWDSPLPPIQEPQEEEHVMGPVVQPLISPAALFPPISAANSRNHDRKLRRVVSDDSIDSAQFVHNGSNRYSSLRTRIENRETNS